MSHLVVFSIPGHIWCQIPLCIRWASKTFKNLWIWSKSPVCRRSIWNLQWTLYSHKILMKQRLQGWLREVSSVGNSRQALTGFNSGSLAELYVSQIPWSKPCLILVYSGRVTVAYLLYRLDIPFEVCKGLTKCWGSKVLLVVLSKFYESAARSGHRYWPKLMAPFGDAILHYFYLQCRLNTGTRWLRW